MEWVPIVSAMCSDWDCVYFTCLTADIEVFPHAFFSQHMRSTSTVYVIICDYNKFLVLHAADLEHARRNKSFEPKICLPRGDGNKAWEIFIKFWKCNDAESV